MIRRIMPVVASIALIGTTNLTAYADDMLDKDYIVSEIWADWWQGKGDDGLIFPEASYKHHVLSDWVDDNYGNEDYDWSEIGQLKYNFRDYYDELTESWDFNDDRDGNWTIVTDETTYSFNLSDGKWLMGGSNGDVVDSFMPFSTLEDKNTDAEKQVHAVNAEGENGNTYRVGKNLKIDEEAADVMEEATEIEEIEGTSSNGLIYVVVGIVLAGIAILAGVLMKKKRG